MRRRASLPRARQPSAPGRLEDFPEVSAVSYTKLTAINAEVEVDMLDMKSSTSQLAYFTQLLANSTEAARPGLMWSVRVAYVAANVNGETSRSTAAASQRARSLMSSSEQPCSP